MYGVYGCWVWLLYLGEVALLMSPSSLDRISRQFGPVRVDVLGKIAEATLGGLTYLYIKHHIIYHVFVCENPVSVIGEFEFIGFMMHHLHMHTFHDIFK